MVQQNRGNTVVSSVLPDPHAPYCARKADGESKEVEADLPKEKFYWTQCPAGPSQCPPSQADVRAGRNATTYAQVDRVAVTVLWSESVFCFTPSCVVTMPPRVTISLSFYTLLLEHSYVPCLRAGPSQGHNVTSHPLTHHATSGLYFPAFPPHWEATCRATSCSSAFSCLSWVI